MHQPIIILLLLFLKKNKNQRINNFSVSFLKKNNFSVIRRVYLTQFTPLLSRRILIFFVKEMDVVFFI